MGLIRRAALRIVLHVRLIRRAALRIVLHVRLIRRAALRIVLHVRLIRRAALIAYEYLNFVGNGFESLGSLIWILGSPAVSNAVYGIILLAILV